jgi:O-methyltransferase involved in polyketide biosynthesis
MQNTSPNQLLASTAAWTAGVRARESERKDRLLDDPWADVLAGEEGMAWIAARPAESVLPIVIRTRRGSARWMIRVLLWPSVAGKQC